MFRTTDPKHPGVEKVMQQGAVNIGGRVTALSEGEYPSKYKGLYLRPEEARREFEQRGWTKVAAFQTRNPMHRSHEHLAKIAAEVTDGIFIHQVLGKLKAGDIPAEVRTRAIQAMIDNYFKPNIAIQAGYPIEMRYAGPREAAARIWSSDAITPASAVTMARSMPSTFSMSCGTARCCVNRSRSM